MPLGFPGLRLSLARPDCFLFSNPFMRNQDGVRYPFMPI